MKYWEKLSKTIFKLAARKSLKKFQANSLESVLKNSLKLLDTQTIDEIKDFIKSQHTKQGGFADKGGKCDLYYTLFGCYIAEALDITELMPNLRNYVKEIIHSSKLEGVYLHSAAILYAKLFEYETLPSNLVLQVKNDLAKPENSKAIYSNFLSLITYYYLEEYTELYKIQRRIKTQEIAGAMPCSVAAAKLVLDYSFGKPVKELEIKIHSFYRKNGSFAALQKAPIGDLLSTGVSLYALKFAKADLRLVTPDCLKFVDSLYTNGGFCATHLDLDPDVEYTFYALLALGALTN